MWDEAWPDEDVESIAALYAPDAVFYSDPFRESQVPAEYVAWVFDDQREAECRFGVPVVEGARAAVDWWGVITSNDGSVTTLAGTSLLRFDESGRVIEQRDVWAEHEGRVELTHWARVP